MLRAVLFTALTFFAVGCGVGWWVRDIELTTLIQTKKESDNEPS